jgi:hypothetical protein
MTGHDSAPASSQGLPTTDDMRRELLELELESFVATFREHLDKTKEMRKVLLAPPVQLDKRRQEYANTDRAS